MIQKDDGRDARPTQRPRKPLAERVYPYGAPVSFRVGEVRRAAPPLPPGGEAGEAEVERVLREVEQSEEKGGG